MTYKFKDDKSRKIAIERIRKSVEEIGKLTNTIQQRAGIINHLSMVNDWYIQENMIAIEEDGEGAEVEHLESCAKFFERYAEILDEVDEILNDSIKIVSDCFNYEDDDIQGTIERVKRCQ